MIYQGIFNILDFYFKEADLFYLEVDSFFREKINNLNELNKIFENNFNKFLEKVSLFFNEELMKVGFSQNEVNFKFFFPIFEEESKSKTEYSDVIDFYDKTITPLIHELIFEKICDYFVGLADAEKFIINLNSLGIFPTVFMVEINELKELYKKDLKKSGNLKKYIQIRELIIQKFLENRENTESLEYLHRIPDKLQLLYLIHRIIDFFYLKKLFDFSHIEIFLKNHLEEWLISLPLSSLRNPEMYYCGIFLAKKLDISCDNNMIKEYLMNLFEEILDEFDNPLLESTCKVYYLIKSLKLMNLKLSKKQIKKIIALKRVSNTEVIFKNMETSYLVIILKIFKMLDVGKKVEKKIIKDIKREIRNRITEDGIVHDKDGLFSSEATYYVLFFYFINHKMEELNHIKILDDILFRIYRNLELLEFSEDINHDLFSEIFYSCESLKLINCIDYKQMSIKIGSYLFPTKVLNKIKESEDFSFDKAHFRHYTIDQITGEVYK